MYSTQKNSAICCNAFSTHVFDQQDVQSCPRISFSTYFLQKFLSKEKSLLHLPDSNPLFWRLCLYLKALILRPPPPNGAGNHIQTTAFQGPCLSQTAVKHLPPIRMQCFQRPLPQKNSKAPSDTFFPLQITLSPNPKTIQGKKIQDVQNQLQT